DTLKGGYVFYENAPDGVQVVLIGTGSELDIVYKAAQQLAGEGVGVRVVSLPSWELFQAQSAEYRAAVLPPGVAKVSL
ncbi:MAG: transketolase, partial [Caldilineaceae bacterium]|nr:transketolase [Caldilineaceae bacterium]